MKSFSHFKPEFRSDVERLLKLFPLNGIVGFGCYEIEGEVEEVQKFEKKLYQFFSYQKRLEKYLSKTIAIEYYPRLRKISHKNG